MARDILCIPATSVPAERLFSEARKMVRKDRCSLNHESIRASVCTNRWMKSSLKKIICEVLI